jgi:hypothetical protein
MSDLIEALLAREGVVKGEPSSRADIESIVSAFGVPMPDTLVKLWLASDGVALEGLDADLFGPTKIREYLGYGTCTYWLEQGFVPLLDDHGSNPLVVAVKEPLAYRVIYQPHDGDMKIMYRTLESWLADLGRVMATFDSADTYLRESYGDYPPDGPRTEDDRQAARVLLRTDGEHDEWKFAINLLDDSNLEEWKALLETQHFVRRYAQARMHQMRSSTIRELLRKDQQAFEEFAKVAEEAARNAGLEVGERSYECLRVGGKGMNLDGFFYRRNIPNAVPRMIAWFEDLIAGRHPYQRPGNYMDD